MLSKEEFLKVMNQVQKTLDYQEDLCAISKKYGSGDVWDYPDCVSETLHLLNMLIELDEHKYFGSDIDYFVFELNFGRNYKPGLVEDKDGNEIDFSSAEKLYDYLVKEKCSE